MQSNGGLAEATRVSRQGCDPVGPAGGVVGMVAASAPHGDERLIGFDMGGTSTDVSHYAGAVRACRRERRRRGAHPRADDADPHRRGRRRVDLPLRRHALPRRAGERRREPGPGLLPQRRAADGHRLQPVARADRPGAFSRGVRPGRRPAARSGSARARLQEVADQLGGDKSLEEIAEGFLDIAVDNMAAAIRKISIARGHDVTPLHARLLRRRRRAACLPRSPMRSAWSAS